MMSEQGQVVYVVRNYTSITGVFLTPEEARDCAFAVAKDREGFNPDAGDYCVVLDENVEFHDENGELTRGTDVFIEQFTIGQWLTDTEVLEKLRGK